MLEHDMPNSSQTITSHHFLIGSPLLVILLFCFAFVMLRPQSRGHSQPVASSHTAASSDIAQSPLPAIPYDNQPVLTKLVVDTSATPADNAGTTAGPQPAIDTSPQSPTTDIDNLQAAQPNNQKTSKATKRLETRGRPIIYKLNQED